MRKRWSTPSLIAAVLGGLLLTPSLVALMAVTGRLPSDAVAGPPAWEAGLGRRALAASLRRRAAGLGNPIADDDETALIAGMALYRNNCAGCHGGPRARSDWGARGFYPRVPQFRQDPVRIAPAEAFVAVRDGIRYSGMGAWRGMMTEAEMWRVANFVSRLHDLPPRVDARWRAGAALPP